VTRPDAPQTPSSAAEDARGAPLAVLPLEYAPPVIDEHPHWRWVVRKSLLLAWPVCCVGVLVLIAFHVESVVVSGPVLFTLGVLAAVGGVFTRDRFAVCLGVTHCAVCVLLFLLVNLLRWSPREAAHPFAVMGSIYTLATLAPTAWYFARARRAAA
jgi:hypothetical protein